MRGLRTASVLAALVTLPVACGLFIGLEPPEGKQLPALPPPAEATPDPCQHAGPPTKPLREDDAGASLPPFWMVVRRSYIGASTKTPDAGVPGFDLDGVCTCFPNAKTAFDAGSSCIPRGGGKTKCDSLNGIDNEFENIVGTYSSVFDLNGFTERVDRGTEAVLIYVAEYNGQPNDLSVTVGFATADGIYTDECDQKLAINDNPPGAHPGTYYRASWRGCDKWHGVEEQFVGFRDDPTQYLPKALGKGFVKDGVLVLSGNVDVPIFFNDTAAAIQDPIVTAPLKRIEPKTPGDPVRFRIEGGLLGGRMPLKYLAQIAFSANYNGFFMCQNPGAFKGLMDSLCGGIDSAESALLDFQGKTCQSMSFAFRFDSDVVDLDRVPRTPDPDSPNPCKPSDLPALDVLCPIGP